MGAQSLSAPNAIELGPTWRVGLGRRIEFLPTRLLIFASPDGWIDRLMPGQHSIDFAGVGSVGADSQQCPAAPHCFRVNVGIRLRGPSIYKRANDAAGSCARRGARRRGRKPSRSDDGTKTRNSQKSKAGQ